MKYQELRKLAKSFGITFSKTPTRKALEQALAEAEAQKATAKAEAESNTNNNPTALRVQAEILRAQADEIAEQARQAEVRAQAIDVARTEEKSATANLWQALVRFRSAMVGLVGLGLPVEWTIPEETVNDYITYLTPPRRVYCFWAEGNYPVGRGYVVAESFDEAKARVLDRDVDYGHHHPGTCGWQVATEETLAQLRENGEAWCEQYGTTVRTETLQTSGIYRFDLTGSEYEGHAVVVASSFDEAKTKALAEQVIGGVIDLSEWEEDDLAELPIAVSGLTENGRVERAGHTLVAKTIA